MLVICALLALFICCFVMYCVCEQKFDKKFHEDHADYLAFRLADSVCVVVRCFHYCRSGVLLRNHVDAQHTQVKIV